MAYTRKIKIEYFKVVIAKKDGSGHEHDYSLENLICKSDTMTMQDKMIQYYQEEARIDKVNFEKSTGYWYLNFLRLRQTKLPLKAWKDKEATTISILDDEFIGEDVTAIYDPNNHILALQRNRDSLSSTGIEYYLTKLYGNNEFGIYLRPILDQGIDDKLKSVKHYRKIALKFATDSHKKRTVGTHTTLSRLLAYFDGFEGYTATLTISLGKGNRKGSLNADTISNLLSEINNSENFVVGGELGVKYNDIEPSDTIDLFSMKCSDTILLKVEKCQSIDYLEIGEKICATYNNKKAKLLMLLKQ